MEFVGITLERTKENLPGHVVQRFKDLWERYWEVVGEEDAKRNPGSRLFAFWFSSGAFDSKWSLVQLESFVTVAPKAGAQHGVMGRLADICGSDPLRSARIVGALVDGDDEGWRIAASQDKAQEVLRIALEAGGEAKDVAERVIDRLGRRGFVEFGGLLKLA